MESAGPPERNDKPVLAILAGGGDLPRQAAVGAKTRGYSVFLVAFEGQTDPRSVEGYPHFWTRLGAADEILQRLHAEKVRDVVLVGPIKRPGFSSLYLDKRARGALLKAGRSVLGDDGLLGGIIKLLEEEEGFRVLGAEHFLSDAHLVPSGILGSEAPDAQALADIDRGREVTAALGRLDIGQAVVVQQGLILGVEAIEGTDCLLERVAALRRPGPGGVLVKMAKPEQEIRADMPTAGPDTVRRAVNVGLRGLALEAGRVLLIDPREAIRIADANDCFILGF